jgi:GNAT superfamily N-acetyltransferase
MSNPRIRAATTTDVPLILYFIKELAGYERAANAVVATEEAIAGSLFDSGSTASAVICERDGEPVGFAVYFFTYSTWLARHGLYLEDLYITPAARGAGVGKALLRHLAQLAVARGCGRFEWSVLDWNRPAIDFYTSAGARPQSEWTTYRLAGEALHAFARDDMN